MQGRKGLVGREWTDRNKSVFTVLIIIAKSAAWLPKRLVLQQPKKGRGKSQSIRLAAVPTSHCRPETHQQQGEQPLPIVSMPRFLLSVLLPFLAFLFANNVHNIHGWPIPVPGGTAAKPSGGISLPPELLFEKSCQKLFSSATSTDWLGGCECAAIPRRMGKGTKCCCTGESVELIADSIDASMELATISRIFLFNASLAQLEADSLVAMSGLEEIFIDSCLQLERVDSRAFASLKMLRKIRISNCPKLRRWEAPMQLKHTPRLQTIIARNNDLRALPPLEMESAMPMERLDFSGNCFSQIGEGAMRNVAAKLVLIDGAGKQCLRSIQGGAFRGCRFVTLHLSDNPRLDQLHEDAFAGILHLDHLDLSGSAIAQLPAFGLNPLKRLSLRRVPSLKQLPPVLAFPNLVHADFTYSHHCCFFKYASRDFYARKAREGEQLDRNLEQNYRELRRRVCSKEQQASGGGQITDAADAEADSEAPSHRLRRKERRHVFVQDGGDALFKQLADWYRNLEQQPLRGNAAVNGTAPIGPEPFVGDELGKGVVLARRCDRNAVDRFFLNISCSPQPDALNPCEDIVSNLPLRVIIWPMWLGAIFGNLAVWAVIGAAWQKKMRLHYLFMLNLSLADFLTGVYLALLAFADLRTANDYYNFAVEWQTGSGCAVAGFLSVFASELSIFSMLMIALEIFYNSRFAFYGRQLSGRGATVALLVGYAYSLGMASLPLLGLASSYQHSSICLPLHIESIADKLYILVGLSLTGLAFGAMVCLYLLLNWTLRHSKASSTTRAEEDRQILRRTLALIGTDMLCWVPTLFFGLTAALGWPLITLSSAKWCLVLFYPINSCANPLLYVFLTRTWRDAKRKAGPLIRRSLAASHPRGTLSWNKLERFYSSGPKSGGNLMRGTGRTAGNGGEEDAEGEAEQRPKTIHCFEGKERRKLLGEVFAGQQQKRRLPIGVRNGRRRASEGDGILGKAAAAKNRKSSSSGPQHSAQENRDQSPPSSSNSSGGQSRKSLLVRPKISAPPQMSDISESSTASLGSSIHQLEPKDQLKEAKKPQMIEKNLASAPSPLEGWQETAKRKAELKRGSVASSNVDGDSGRGDSLRSWAKSARPSVVTLCWDGNQLTDRLLLSRLNCEETTQNEEAEEVGDN